MPLIEGNDKHSAAWKRLREHYEARLAKLRIDNDGDLDPTQTAKLRGKIAEIKLLLGLDKEPPNVPNENARFPD